MLFGLVYDVFGMPVALSIQVLEGLRDEIDRERLVTEPSIKGHLQQLQLDLQDGVLSEAEYEEMEADLITRLRLIRDIKEGKDAA